METVCKYFLKGQCRHGLTGKTPRGEVQQCPWKHTRVCMKFLNYGNTERGCSDNNCRFTHPTMCEQSLKFGTCDMFGTGKKCTKGYHRKGTKPTRNEENKKDISDRSNKVEKMTDLPRR